MEDNWKGEHQHYNYRNGQSDSLFSLFHCAPAVIQDTTSNALVVLLGDVFLSVRASLLARLLWIKFFVDFPQLQQVSETE